MARSPLWDNPEFVQACLTERKKDVMAKWGVSSGLVVDVKKAHGGKLDASRMSVDAAPEEFIDDMHDPEKGDSFRRMAATAWGDKEWREFLREKGTDPDTVTYSFGVTSNPMGGYWNKLLNVRPKPVALSAEGPAWPVIQPATPIFLNVGEVPAKPARDGMMLSLKSADPQIGYRILDNGTYEEFHDWKAMNIFVEVCRREQPDSIVILGDYLDLPSQSRWAQEAGFARTTQMAIDTGYIFLAMLRGVCPDAEIVLIEGNHDKRMQNFIEQNALAAFGLKKAGMPKSWPVMSLPNLLRLDELNVTYMDAYPAAVHWDDDWTRNIHGTRANSKGSTMSQYANDAPHINTWAGHTHRAEIVFKTVIGPRGEAIETYAANPGCLAKTDGTVPSVHGAIHSDGTSARVVEDWQQGFGALLYDGTGQSWPQVYRIKDGRTVYGGQMIAAV